MRQIRFLEYVRPDEADKWYNSIDKREVWINADEVQYVDKKTSAYYNVRGYQTEAIVTRIHMRNGDVIDVEGETSEVLDKLRGDCVK